jgi:hypothetical protein
MLKNHGTKSKVFYDSIAKNLDLACSSAQIETDEKDRIDFGIKKWHSNHGTSVVGLDRAIALESRQIFRFMDKDK